MASTKAKKTAADEDLAEAAPRRTFVTPANRRVKVKPGPDGDEPSHEGSQDNEELLTTRAVVAGVIMLVIALVAGVLAFGSSGSNGPEMSRADTKEIFDLREEIHLAEARAEELPKGRDAERGLLKAMAAADRVAALQNDYRQLTPRIEAADGVLDPVLVASTRRDLTPLFTPSVDASALDPWYLLASDASVPEAVGIPASFDSGFAWIAATPATVEVDGMIPVTWQAIERHPAKGQDPAVLAWASADYDLTGQTFSEVRTGMTVQGAARVMEVKQG
ncbi:hypothetical protein NE857_21350 [Nocardiopsis exhalans]|uniref:Uncharacterized protein n=1 Tax=Nocardiopsis exhalans TaxID=163604 RepID=A0ABY5D431_9ACTN|nr:hypothetical protein [Nocardiopsis exhalans]USY17863.1 hypothetical protein NE857_21350 [Nocardiopsis exhalans]